MKTRTPNRQNLIFAAMTVAVSTLATSSALAQSGSWTGGGNQSFPDCIWGGPANWVGNTIPSGANNTATFGSEFRNGYATTKNVERTLGHVVYNDPQNGFDFILRRSTTDIPLTLSVSQGQPTLSVNQAGRTFVMDVRIAGTIGFAKNGLGRLVLSNADSTYTGPITINAGMLEIGGGVFKFFRGPAATRGLVEVDFNVGDIGRVGNGNYAGPITIAAGAEFFYNSSAATILNGAISGGGALTKGRSGILTLAGSNDYTGGTTATGGILLPATPAALAGYDAAGRVVFGGGTIAVSIGDEGWTTGQVETMLVNATKTAGALGIDTTNGDANQWTAFTATNFGLALGLTKLGDNTLTLNQANSYNGATTVARGTLALSGAGTLGSGAGDLILAGGALDLGGAGTTAGALSITAAAASGTTISNGSLTGVSYAASNPTGNAVVSASLLANGAAGFTKSGAGTVTLAGANTYTGATEVNSGNLIFSTVGSATTGVTVADGAGGGVFLASAGGQWTNTGDLTLGDGSSVLVDFGSAAPSTSVAPMKVANLVSGTGHSVRISGASYAGLAVGQTYPLLTWTGIGPADASEFGVPVMVHRVDGILSVTGNALNLTMAYNAPGPVSWNTGNGTWDTLSTLWLDSGGAATSFIDTLDAVVFGDSPGVTGNPIVTLDGTLSPVSVTMNSTQRDYSITGTGAIIGAASLTLDAANTRTLGIATFNNAYSGDTTIHGGTLKLLDFEVIPHGAGKGNVIVDGSGVFDLNGQTEETINGLSGNGTVDTLAAGSTKLTVGGNNATSTFGGTIRNTAGDLALAKTGTGTLTLTGANTYSGGTTISGGVLQLGDGGTSGSIGAGLVTITAGTLDFNRSDSLALANEITGAGGVRQIGAGTTTLSGTDTYSGTTTVSAGQLNLPGRVSPTMGVVTVGGAEGATLEFSGSDAFSIATRMFVGTGTTGTGVVNQTGGDLSFTAGDALLLGNGSGSTGIYNLSAGTLTTFASAARGVMIGVNSGCAGTFNLSATGDLLAGHLAVGRNDAVSTDCTVAFNQTGGIATVTNLSIGGYSGATNTAATFSLTGGVFAATTFQNLTGAASSSAQLTLGGSAEATLPAFPVPAGTANLTLDFTTGFISPAAASGSYMRELTGAFLTANGANFNVPADRNITVGQAFQDAPSQQGVLRKTGDGTLVLTGSSTYTGDTLVSGGALKFATSATSATDVTAAAGGAAGAQLAGTDGQWDNTGALTVDSGGTLEIAYGVFQPSTSTAPVKVTDFSVASGAGIRIAGSGFVSGQSYPLVTWTGNGPANGSAFTASAYPGLLGNLTVAGNTLSLNVTELVFISWNTGDGDWDTVTPNWVDNSLAPVAYAEGNSVVFGDAAGATGDPVVNLGSTVTPLGVTMNSTGRDYTITGLGSITGGVSLALAPANTRTLTVSTANSFTGGVKVGGGTLRVGNNQALGAIGNMITVAAGATLNTNGAMTANRDYHAVIVGAGVDGNGAIVNTGAGHNFGFGAITLSGDATIGGTGRFDLRPAVANGGLLALGSHTLTKAGANLFAIVEATITGAGTININSGTLSMTRSFANDGGTINVGSGATLFFENNTVGAYTQALNVNNGTVNLSGGNVALAAPVTTTGNATFNTASTLTLSGVVSGDGNVTKTAGGVLQFLGAESNTFTGNFLLHTNGGGNIFLGKTDGAVAIPAGATIEFGVTTLTGQPNLRMLQDNQFGDGVRIKFNNPWGQWIRLDLLGTDQSLAGISTGSPTVAGGGVVQNRENGNNTAARGLSVLTLTGNVDDPGYPVGGYYFNGHLRDSDNTPIDPNNRLEVVKNGTATQTFTTSPGQTSRISFSGNLTVNAGRLIGSGARNNQAPGNYGGFGAGLNTRTITVNSGGILDFAVGNMWGNHNHTNVPTLVVNGGTVTNSDAAEPNGRVNNALNNVVLNAGTLTSTTGNSLSVISAARPGEIYGAWGINGSVTSSGASFISTTSPAGVVLLGSVGGDTAFNVTDGTLTVSAPLQDGDVGVLAKLVKEGAGTMVLSAANVYTTDTIVNDGTLALAGSGSLRFKVTDSGSNQLTGTGNVTLDGAFTIDTTAVTTTTGTWTLVDAAALTESYGGTFAVTDYTPEGGGKWVRSLDTQRWTFDQTTGVLTLGQAADPYGNWASLAGLDGTNNGYTMDPDNDGVPNILEFYLNGNPLAANAGILPQPSVDGDYLVFTFSRRDDAAATALTQAFQYGSTLVGWTTVAIAPGNYAGVIVEVADGAEVDAITVKVPRALEVAGKLFGRLNIEMPER